MTARLAVAEENYGNGLSSRRDYLESTGRSRGSASARA